jgi:hypothetical protein
MEKTMAQHLFLRAVAAAALTLAASGAAWAQSTLPQENAMRAAEQAVADKARASVEAAKAKPRVGGYWRLAEPVTALKTVDGKAPPLTAAGRALLNTRVADRKAGKNDDPMNACLPPGTPRSVMINEPFLITQAAAKITFFHQVHHVIRHVYLDGPLKLGDRDVLWEGHSSGRWEGDTLIIESGDFNGQQWVDNVGLPQSPDMRVSERFRLVDADTLEDSITFDDAKYYTAPWTARLLFKRQPASTLLVEEDCAEKLLDFPMKPYAPD